MSFIFIRAVFLAMLLACAVFPAAYAGKNDIGEGSDNGSMPIVPPHDLLGAGATAASWFWQSYLMQAFTTVFPHLSTTKAGYLEVTNLPEAEGDSATQKVGQQMIALVQKALGTLPEYDKTLGLPVTRAWSPRSGTFLVEVQSARLADIFNSAPHVLHVLTMGEQKLGMRTITAGDVEAEGITLCGWTRRQRFLMHFLLLGAAISGIGAIFSSSGWTLDIFATEAPKIALPFHGASVVGGSSGFHANQQTSCVARSVPKEWGQDHWDI